MPPPPSKNGERTPPAPSTTSACRSAIKRIFSLMTSGLIDAPDRLAAVIGSTGSGKANIHSKECPAKPDIAWHREGSLSGSSPRPPVRTGFRYAGTFSCARNSLSRTALTIVFPTCVSVPRTRSNPGNSRSPSFREFVAIPPARARWREESDWSGTRQPDIVPGIALQFSEERLPMKGSIPTTGCALRPSADYD